MINTKKEQGRDKFHRAMRAIADELRADRTSKITSSVRCSIVT